jgi:hypothetical protein
MHVQRHCHFLARSEQRTARPATIAFKIIKLPNPATADPEGLATHLVLDRLCGLVVTVSGYRSRGPGSIPDATRFSEK